MIFDLRKNLHLNLFETRNMGFTIFLKDFVNVDRVSIKSLKDNFKDKDLVYQFLKAEIGYHITLLRLRKLCFWVSQG